MLNLDHVMPVCRWKTITFLMNCIFIIPITMATLQIILVQSREVITMSCDVLVVMYLWWCLCYVGLQTCYNLFVLLYLVVIVLWGQKVWQIISKGGPMHSVLKMLSVTVVMELMSSLLMALYYWRCACVVCVRACVWVCVCTCLCVHVSVYMSLCTCLFTGLPNFIIISCKLIPYSIRTFTLLLSSIQLLI